MQPVYRDIHSELIVQCRRGDRAAQHELYRHFASPMYNCAFRLLKNEDDTKDVLQEAFIDMFAKLDSFRSESSFAAWFKRIVVNKSLNQLKKKKQWFVDVENLEIAETIDEIEVSSRYEMAELKRAIDLLPEGYRLVFALYMFEDYTHREIASEMGISEATSKSQLSRARASLRKLLTENKN